MLNNPLSPEERTDALHKSFKLYLTICTAIYAILLPFVVYFSVIFLMIMFIGDATDFISVFIMLITVFIPISIPISIYWAWSKYLQRNYIQAFLLSETPLLLFIGPRFFIGSINFFIPLVTEETV